jgi:hypothetical protein
MLRGLLSPGKPLSPFFYQLPAIQRRAYVAEIASGGISWRLFQAKVVSLGLFGSDEGCA